MQPLAVQDDRAAVTRFLLVSSAWCAGSVLVPGILLAAGNDSRFLLSVQAAAVALTNATLIAAAGSFALWTRPEWMTDPAIPAWWGLLLVYLFGANGGVALWNSHASVLVAAAAGVAASILGLQTMRRLGSGRIAPRRTSTSALRVPVRPLPQAPRKPLALPKIALPTIAIPKIALSRHLVTAALFVLAALYTLYLVIGAFVFPDSEPSLGLFLFLWIAAFVALTYSKTSISNPVTPRAKLLFRICLFGAPAAFVLMMLGVPLAELAVLAALVCGAAAAFMTALALARQPGPGQEV